jgi:hypothetical protein
MDQEDRPAVMTVKEHRELTQAGALPHSTLSRENAVMTEQGGGGSKVTRIVKPRPGEAVIEHGPVRQSSQMHPFEVVTFTGGEESDVLHAAGAWMAEHPYTIVVAMNGQYVYPDEDSSL